MSCLIHLAHPYFNPRSLAGATVAYNVSGDTMLFQSTLPRGSDDTSLWRCTAAAVFQSTLPRGSDMASLLLIALLVIFQSTLPRGSDYSCVCNCVVRIYFNPRSLAGATSLKQLSHRCTAISIHAPSRERPLLASPYALPNEFQSTLPRGSDSLRSVFSLSFGISIHAPSRERPKRTNQDILESKISIHAPSRERPLLSISCSPRCAFQSTLPRGSDF